MEIKRRESKEGNEYNIKIHNESNHLYEQTIKQLEQENSQLKSLIESMKNDQDSNDLLPKIHNSYYQNIYINDMKKDLASFTEEHSKYRIRIAALESEVEKLKSNNEYLNKLLK